ncbi:MAG: hypothetical protein ABI947_10520, partial [Chloroflexota bacterium]
PPIFVMVKTELPTVSQVPLMVKKGAEAAGCPSGFCVRLVEGAGNFVCMLVVTLVLGCAVGNAIGKGLTGVLADDVITLTCGVAVMAACAR